VDLVLSVQPARDVDIAQLFRGDTMAKLPAVNVRLEGVSATEERSAGLTTHEKSPASAGPFWDGSDGTRTRDLCRDRAAL
jgi:hypothetical protein